MMNLLAKVFAHNYRRNLPFRNLTLDQVSCCYFSCSGFLCGLPTEWNRLHTPNDACFSLLLNMLIVSDLWYPFSPRITPIGRLWWWLHIVLSWRGLHTICRLHTRLIVSLAHIIGTSEEYRALSLYILSVCCVRALQWCVGSKIVLNWYTDINPLTVPGIDVSALATIIVVTVWFIDLGSLLLNY